MRQKNSGEKGICDRKRSDKTETFKLKMMTIGKDDGKNSGEKILERIGEVTQFKRKMRGEVQRKGRDIKKLELLELYTSSI